MIIKSTSRKSKTFSQLFEYLLREKEFETNSWNMYASKENLDDVIKEFMENAQHIDNARGSVYMYHEILSLEKNNLSMQEQKKILHDLAQQYINIRAKDNLIFSVTHTDKANTHIHMVISANKIQENKRMRLSKKLFNSIKKQLEAYKNQQYPQLKKTLFYDKAKNFNKPSRAEQEMKHKRNKQSKKEFVKEQLREFLKTSKNEKVFKSTLEKNGFEFYVRGKNKGVKYKDQSFRFSTLGLDKTYAKFTKEKSTYEQEKTQNSKQEAYSDSKEKTAEGSTFKKDEPIHENTHSR